MCAQQRRRSRASCGLSTPDDPPGQRPGDAGRRGLCAPAPRLLQVRREPEHRGGLHVDRPSRSGRHDPRRAPGQLPVPAVSRLASPAAHAARDATGLTRAEVAPMYRPALPSRTPAAALYSRMSLLAGISGTGATLWSTKPPPRVSVAAGLATLTRSG